MKTKIRLFQIENLGNVLSLNNTFKILFLFFFTISAFGQNNGIEFTCTNFDNLNFDVTISFGAPDGIRTQACDPNGNEYAFWTTGTDSFGGTGYTLEVEYEGQNCNAVPPIPGTPIWSVREAGSPGARFFKSAVISGELPSCISADWERDLAANGQFCEALIVDCVDGDEDMDGVPTSIDCDDTNASITTVDVDKDGACSDVDCDDNDATIYPGAPELCDGLDNDCNTLADDGLTFTTYYADIDGDLFGDPLNSESTCDGAPVGYVEDETDCDDSDATIYPGAEEVINDGIDQDCNGSDATFPYCNSQQTKVTVCHNGNVTLCISINALETHLDHGDSLGPCDDDKAEDEDVTDPLELVSWPNPSNTYFNLILLNSIKGNDTIEIRVYDLNGRLVFNKKGETNQVQQIGSSWPAGLYFVNVTQANETRQVKLIKY